jgi:sugar phosphate isomerase/epimerase
MNIKRREFLKSMAAASAVMSFGGLTKLSGAEKELPIGIQLYTVRSKTGKDFKGTLKKLVDIGYKNFEFAGYGGMDAGELLGFMGDIGANTCGAHEGYDGLLKDFDSVLDFNQAIGNPYMVVPSMPGRVRTGGADDIKRFADNLNTFGFKARKAGVQIGYHNHSFEFKKVDGEKTVWDILFSHADVDMLKAEVDIAWVYNAGLDPVEFLETWDERIKLLHMKDMDENKKLSPIGEGIIDMKGVVKKAKEIGVDWFIVEQDKTRKGKDIMDEVALSYKNLSKLLS